MSKKQHNNSDFQNESHIARKLKAQSRQSNIHTKRVKDILEQIDANDMDEEEFETSLQYARYIR